MANVTNITKRIIDQTRPSDRTQFLWDAELRGFGIRTERTGTKTFIVRYRPKGQGRAGSKRFVSIGRYGALTAEEARQRAKTILGAVAAGEDPAGSSVSKGRPLTFGEAVELFLVEHVNAKRKPATERDYRSVLQSYALPKLHNRSVESVTRGEIARLHVEMKERPIHANRLVATISSLYSFLERRGLVPEGMNPARKIEKYREHRRERFLTTDELERLGEAIHEGETIGLRWQQNSDKPPSKHAAKVDNQYTILSSDVAAAFSLLILTGARLSEILDLQWAHVDLQRGLLLLPDSKTGRKTIVLNRPALVVIQNHRRLGPYVICGNDTSRPRTDLKRPWQLICAHARLEGVRIHDLRHTFASIGVGASLGLPIVGKLLGHSQPQTTARYAHLDAEPLRRAADIIGEQIDAAMRGRTAMPGLQEIWGDS